MRLERYINEVNGNINIVDKHEDIGIIGDIIKKDCGPFLKEFDIKKNIFYRGTRPQGYDFSYKKTRKDRKPKDTQIKVHEWMDKWGKDTFGWFWRSKGVFTSDNEHSASEYGYTYIFFPIGDYKYLYNKDINDIADHTPPFVDYVEQYDKGEKVNSYAYEQGKLFVENILNKYTDKGLSKYANKSVNGIEVVWNCKEYYLLNIDYEKQLIKYLK